MIMILLKSLGKRTSIGSYYDEKSLTKCYCPRPHWPPLAFPDSISQDIHLHLSLQVPMHLHGYSHKHQYGFL